MRFIVAREARITGALLERMVREQFREKRIAEPDCVVCYGAGYNGPLPTLNASAGRFSKMEQGRQLARALIGEALPIATADEMLRNVHMTVPWIARKTNHTKGKDIRVCKSPRQVRLAIEKGRTYFTPFVPSDTEYRAFVYRRRVLCVYEKRLTEPEKNVKFGRNRQNGWTFHGLNSDHIPESVRRVAVAAVQALGLDFGAVDILGKWDRDHTDVAATVLEVNSAPGVQDEHRTSINKLATRVVKWAAAGCPARETN